LAVALLMLLLKVMGMRPARVPYGTALLFDAAVRRGVSRGGDDHGLGRIGEKP